MGFSEWTLHGRDYRESFERELKPQHIYDELNEYQETFGDEFGINELLHLYDIRSKVLIAEAICNAPEFLCDQIGKMRNSGEVSTISGSLRDVYDGLDNISNALDDIASSIDTK